MFLIHLIYRLLGPWRGRPIPNLSEESTTLSDLLGPALTQGSQRFFKSPWTHQLIQEQTSVF
jgi:hypothetical protein